MCFYSSEKKQPEYRDDFYQGFGLGDDDIDFSDKLSHSTLLMDTDSQFRSDLDSSFSQLSDINDLEEPMKSSKQLSSFSKFKKDQRRTADSVDGSDNDSNNGEAELRIKLAEPEQKMEDADIQPSKPQKKRRRRRDVVFKRILRECRRFFQVQLSDLTGFVASKKPRKDDYIYR